MGLEYATTLDVGKRKRERGGINEDSVAVNVVDEGHRDTQRRCGVFVLADGAGGTHAGDVASYVATVEVARQLTDRLWHERRLGEVLDLGDGGPVGTGSAIDPGAGLDTAATADRGETADHGEAADRGGRSDSGGTPDVGSAVRDPLADVADDVVQQIVADAVHVAHVRLLEVIRDLDLENAYTTVVAGVAVGDRLHYGWVGDSRAYVVNTAPDRPADQRVTRLTRDHSEVERLVTEGEIDEVEAHVHRRGNRITRAVGGTRNEDPATSSVAVDTASVPLFGDDVVLFTSDGLVDAYTGAPALHRAYEDADEPEDTDAVTEEILEKSVTDDEIGDVVLEAESLSAAADRFVDLSNERGGKDNVSLVLFRDPDLPPAPDGPLPIRVYDPDPQAVIDWETVKQYPEE